MVSCLEIPIEIPQNIYGEFLLIIEIPLKSQYLFIESH